MTNREFYQSIGELVKRYASSTRTLEQYLLALLGLARLSHNQSALPLSDFFRLLTNAFTAAPIAFAPTWREQYDTLDETRPGFAGWEAEIIRQMVDLREMDEVGTLKDEQRYCGLNAPRGANWYNFDPGTFLECAMAGSLGGWEPGDATGRDFVPGQVTVMGSDGIQSMDPQDIERPIIDVPTISWEQFQDFLFCGQTYE